MMGGKFAPTYHLGTLLPQSLVELIRIHSIFFNVADSVAVVVTGCVDVLMTHEVSNFKKIFAI